MHIIPARWGERNRRSLCGVIPTGEHDTEWHWTDDPVTCQRCALRQKRLDNLSGSRVD